jgi:hypothetical protein
VGRVQDVRMVKDGPVEGAFGAALRVTGLVVGTSMLGARLGLDRPEVTGPWLLKAFFGAIRSDRYVEWERVSAIEQGRIRIRGAKAELPGAHPAE